MHDVGLMSFSFSTVVYVGRSVNKEGGVVGVSSKLPLYIF